ncbi:siderophore iron transporter [Fusarium albosuccineum]|uniref:Siderophore iron transporter n=1 Tax=Fusarium albosuccineum TaxID=1237068 RepID=A0A8H4LH01_9HYPO|nr:siderophore iron transporter [Fusarium albosuccineum]
MANPINVDDHRADNNHVAEKSSPATVLDVPKPDVPSSHPKSDSESANADSEGDKETPGPLQQILTRNQQILAHVLIWMVVFVLGFSNNIFRVLTPYVVSDFRRHALTATTDVVANIASGIIRLPYAKLLDVWGRPHCLSLMVTLTVVGAVMMAACDSVETYCAAQVFYYVGYYGIQFSLVIFISDSAPIRNRALLFGIVWSPSLISTWAYGPAADRILSQIGYRWGFGVWCIIIPIVSTPLLILMFKFDKTAREAGLIKRPEHGRNFTQSIIFYLQEFDVFGLLILATGLSLLLLALSIYSYQNEGWGSPFIISFLVFGPLLIIAFVVYETYLASSSFLPWHLMKDRTVVWTNIMAATLYTSEFISSAYIYSMLIVVFNQSITQATYINSIYYVGSSFWTLILGVSLRYYGRIKIYTLVLGIPFFILGQGLMIAFKPGFTPVALMVVCKILISFGGGTMYPIEQMSLMAVSQEHTPALLAVESVIIDVGKGAGSAIATAIWTSVFKKKLTEYLPASELPSLDDIYGSLDVQSSYPSGSAASLAIDHAYLDTQRVIFISSTALLAITWASVLFWKDIDVKKMTELRKGI